MGHSRVLWRLKKKPKASHRVQYPECPLCRKLIPTEANTTAHFDSVEAGKAIASLKALADSKSYPIDLHLNGGIVMSSPDEKGEVTIPADIEGGEVKVRIEGAYLMAALRACGGMVDFAMTDGKSPVLFTVDGYQLVVMPMLTGERQPEAEPASEAEPAPEAEPEPEADTEAEPEPEAVEPKAEKPKRSRKREKVAVA